MKKRFSSWIVFSAALLLLPSVFLNVFSCSSSDAADNVKNEMASSSIEAVTASGTTAQDTQTAEAGISEAEKEKIALDKELMDSGENTGNDDNNVNENQDTYNDKPIDLDASPDGSDYTLLIITPYEFLAASEMLAQHKNSTGISARVLTLEAVYDTYSGADEAEEVKRCLVDHNLNSRTNYALLVGDCDKFPVRYTKAESEYELLYEELSFPTLFFPSDLYYSDLFKTGTTEFADWDANKNGYYGEIIGDRTAGEWNVDKLDYHPEIAVGRLPVSTIDEAEKCVLRIISYELNAYGSDWIKKVMLISNRYNDGFCKVNSDLAKEEFKDFEVIKLNASAEEIYSEEIQEKMAADIAGGAEKQHLFEETTYEPDPQIVAEYINEGVGAIGYAGHGSQTEWWYSLNMEYLGKLNDNGIYPVVYANACFTSQFSTAMPAQPYTDIDGIEHKGNQDGEILDKDNPPQPACIQKVDFDGFGEGFLVKSPGGAVSYMGFVTIGDICTDSSYITFFKDFLDPEKLLGDVFKEALRETVDDYIFKKLPEYINEPKPGTVHVLHQPLIYILLGDPTLRIGGIKK